MEDHSASSLSPDSKNRPPAILYGCEATGGMIS
jgi:hypothetical protein